jgi:hypothetical protein
MLTKVDDLCAERDRRLKEQRVNHQGSGLASGFIGKHCP